MTKKYINEVVTWSVNKAKWKGATEFCLDRQWEFKIITEKELKVNGNPKSRSSKI